MEASLEKLSPGPRNQHVTTFSRTKVCPPGDVSDRHPEVGWAGAADTVKSYYYGHLIEDPLALWQSAKHITKNWGEVLKLA